MAQSFITRNSDTLIIRNRQTNGRTKARRGDAQRFYRDIVLPYEGEDCLIWPFACSLAGYGKIGGKPGIVSRRLCEEAHGAPPTPKHEAAHSCGNGRHGCVTKRHLSWKTRVENQADRIEHGTHNRGERHNFAKLTEKQVREILALKGVEKIKDTAARYGVSFNLISLINLGKVWRHIQ